MNCPRLVNKSMILPFLVKSVHDETYQSRLGDYAHFPENTIHPDLLSNDQ